AARVSRCNPRSSRRGAAHEQGRRAFPCTRPGSADRHRRSARFPPSDSAGPRQRFSGDPPCQTKVESDPTFGKVESDPTFRKVESDPTFGKVESDPTFRKVESDPTLRAAGSPDL